MPKAANALRGLAADGMVILDEIHHAGHERAWGDGVFQAFELAAKRLSLSGTPFRSDSAKIPFVRYDVMAEGDLAHADYTYGYADALRDGGVVRPVYFPRVDGQMEWSTPSGDVVRATFGDDLTRDHGSARLRTALSLDGDWLPTVLGQAHDRLHARSASSSPTPVGSRSPPTRNTPRASSACSATVSTSSPKWSSATIREHRARSPTSRTVTDPGSSPCAWCPRASTSPACASASTPPPPRQSCSSARPSAASSAGKPGGRARRLSCTSPTILGSGCTRSRSPRHGGTCCAHPARVTTTSSRWTAGWTHWSATTTCSNSSHFSASCRRRRRASASTESPRTACSSSTRSRTLPTRRSPTDPTLAVELPDIPTEAGSVAWNTLSVAEQKDDLRTRNADVAKRLVDLTGWGHAQRAGGDEPARRGPLGEHRHDRAARTSPPLQRELVAAPPRRLTVLPGHHRIAERSPRRVGMVIAMICRSSQIDCRSM